MPCVLGLDQADRARPSGSSTGPPGGPQALQATARARSVSPRTRHHRRRRRVGSASAACTGGDSARGFGEQADPAVAVVDPGLAFEPREGPSAASAALRAPPRLRRPSPGALARSPGSPPGQVERDDHARAPRRRRARPPTGTVATTAPRRSNRRPASASTGPVTPNGTGCSSGRARAATTASPRELELLTAGARTRQGARRRRRARCSASVPST